MQSHPVPEVCSSNIGQDSTGFFDFAQLDSNVTIPANTSTEEPDDGITVLDDDEWNDDEGDWNCPPGMPCGNGTSDGYYNSSHGMNCTHGVHCGNGSTYGGYNCSQQMNCVNGTLSEGGGCMNASRCNSSATDGDNNNNNNRLPEGQGSAAVMVSRYNRCILLMALGSAFF
jgi:hypothetical protein